MKTETPITARSINHRVNKEQLERVLEAKKFISEPYRMHVIETQWLNQKTAKTASLTNVTQKHYEPISIDNKESDVVMLWQHGKQESNVILIERNQIQILISKLKSLCN